jgi:hypothetical protein
MVQHLARRGISKPIAAPPLEFVCIVRKQWNDASSAVVIITELYCRARFGQRPLTTEELVIAQDNLRQLIALER